MFEIIRTIHVLYFMWYELRLSNIKDKVYVGILAPDFIITLRLSNYFTELIYNIITKVLKLGYSLTMEDS